MAETPAIPAALAGDTRSGMDRRERRRWIAAFIMAFALGFLLAWYLLQQSLLPGCAGSLADNGAQHAARGNSGTHGAPDKGSGVKLGAPGDGNSSPRHSSGTTTADGGGGAAGKGGPGDGDLGHGTPWRAKGDASDANGSSNSAGTADSGGPDASGDAPGGGGGDAKIAPPQELHGELPQRGTDPPPPSGDGTAGGAGAAPASAPGSAGTPAPDGLVAKDLRYDKSELPRYPNAVTQSASATPLLNGPKPTDPNLSVSTILTRDDLPKVAAWYHDHLPGWSEQNLGQMAMFWPPDRKADPRTVWLVVDPKTGQTGAILWKPKAH
ncbi:MAG TPA: hypothetical protein VL176_02900 [Steroidobacteraceae bacterium]|nr:hypothetical protein [Steroidobacteraceae bacterium]